MKVDNVMRCGRGFTLIELMITVAIVAILAAIAYPSYIAYLVRSNRAATQSYLLDMANRQQQYLMDARTYATSMAALSNGAAAPTDVSNYYTVDIPSASATAFALKATPVATSTNKDDGWLQVDETGAKTSQYPGKW